MTCQVNQGEDCVKDFLSTTCDLASCVTVGNFDGVHLGHKQLIKVLLESAQRNNLQSVALTFSPHPGEFFSKKRLKLLLPLQSRVDLLKQAGIEDVKVIGFSKLFSEMTYIQFLDHLIERYQLKELIIGENTHIGKARQGSPEKIKDYLQKKQIHTEIIKIQQIEGDCVSSSKIRELVAIGDIAKANKLLGYPYFLHGQVVKGCGKGTALGFPTANLDYQDGLCIPRKGVYKTKVELKGKSLSALTNIGLAPTLKDSKEVTVETYIPEYQGPPMYGQKITINFYDRIRSEKKFPSVDLLKEQIKKDLKRLQEAASN